MLLHCCSLSYLVKVALIHLPTKKTMMSLVSTAGYPNSYRYISCMHIIKKVQYIQTHEIIKISKSIFKK